MRIFKPAIRIAPYERRETEGIPIPPPECGELTRTKAMIAAAVKVFWLKRGSRDEGRDGSNKSFYFGRQL